MQNNSRLKKIQDTASRRLPRSAVDQFVESVAANLDFGFPSAELTAQVRAQAQHSDELSPAVRQLLIEALQHVVKRAMGFAAQLAVASINGSTCNTRRPGAGEPRDCRAGGGR